MTYLIKKVEKQEISPLYEIIVKCGEEMFNSYNLSHWHPYVDEHTFIASLKDKDIYGVYKNNSAIATFNVSTKARDYYHESLWNIPAAKALYLGQLATDPSLQCKGIGKWCMQLVEMIAREMGCTVIRFDALAMHPWLKSFYENLGYSACQLVTVGKLELLCYDKHIS